MPDCYRGTEFWDFNLVDPDNRRPVDYDKRRGRLDDLLRAAKTNTPEFARDLSTRWPDPDIKLWTTSRCLGLRRDCPDLFSFGEYVPLTVIGQAADHVVAFARRLEDENVIIVVPRHYYQLSCSSTAGSSESGPPRADWVDTNVIIPDDFPQRWQCELSGRALESNVADNQHTLAVTNMFEIFPVAVLKPASI